MSTCNLCSFRALYARCLPEIGLFLLEPESQVESAWCHCVLHDRHECCADVRTEGGGWHGNKGGEMTVDAPGQHVLERTSCSISNQARPLASAWHRAKCIDTQHA